MKIEGDGLDGKRILVVEDERLIALYNQDLLEDWGCSVVGPAGSVSSALELLEADVPDAAVIDFDLGGETSEPVAEALVKANRPFLVTTAYDPQHLGAYTSGVHILGKPVDERELRTALARLFNS